MSSPGTTPASRHAYGATFWVGLVVGWAIIAYGVRGVFVDAARSRPFDLAVWVVAADLVVDWLVLPAVGLVGLLVARFARPPWRAPLTAGLFASAVVLAVAVIPLRGYRSVAGNPSLQPLDYPTAVLWVLGAVWVLAGTWCALAVLRSPRARRGRGLPP